MALLVLLVWDLGGGKVFARIKRARCGGIGFGNALAAAPAGGSVLSAVLPSMPLSLTPTSRRAHVQQLPD